MIMQTKMKTIFLLVGPTESGKTTFATEVLIPSLQREVPEKNFRTNVQYLSSDAIRQELLGHRYDKYEQVMMESSDQAFELLFTKLRAVTSFPINADFIIVDTTGLAEPFRQSVLDIAKENHYNIEAIVFDYKNIGDYYTSERSKKLIASHVQRLRRDVLPTLRKQDYKAVTRIKSKDFYDVSTHKINPAYQIHISDFDEHVTHILPSAYDYIIVGDVHECVTPLKELIASYGFAIKDNLITSESASNKRFVLVGDWIDKGGNTKEIIEFLHMNRHWFYFVKGNHENFVAKYLEGAISDKEVSQEVRDKYFTSLPFLKEDETLKENFFELIDLSKDFYQSIGSDSPSFYVTHAPCENKYIGKLDAVSRRNQRKFSTIHNEPVESQLAFLEKESVFNHPYHVFGHVAAKKVVRLKNKIGIDTGCASGNELTAVDFIRQRSFFKSVRSSEEITEELPILFPQQKKVRIQELEESEQKRLKYVLKNKINFISGTMSPSDKDEEKNDLESLEKGLDYFRNAGVDHVVLQPKYMGSRCNIYLSQDVEDCYAVSRNGYRIQHIDVTPAFVSLQERFGEYMRTNDVKTMILDGELLPWSSLGEGLINKDFKVVSESLKSELAFLKSTGFDQHFQHVLEGYEESNYAQLEIKSSKKELVERFGYATYSSYKNLKEFLPCYQPLEAHEEALETFNRQLELYGQEAPLAYKPFSLLKIVFNDGSEAFPDLKTSELFSFLSDDEQLVISLNDPQALDQAQAFFNELTTERKMEGVVIKPEKTTPGVAPYMKVRNTDYLSIVYGYDYQFPHKKAKLMKEKRIHKKLKTSISEYKIGQEMLTHSLDSIDPGNKEYVQVVANMLFETNQEKSIDPRL